MLKKTRALLLLGLMLTACGGGSEKSEQVVFSITAENAVELGQEATTSVDGVTNAGADLQMIIGDLGAILGATAGVPSPLKSGLAAAAETVDCAGGGTLTVDASEGASGEQTANFTANQCADGSGQVFEGELAVTIREWTEYASGAGTAVEILIETGRAGFSNEQCEFRGGIAVRVHEPPLGSAGSSTTLTYEYGATADGFISRCEPDSRFGLAPNTLVHSEFEVDTARTSATVSISGGIETPGGDGYVEVFGEGLEYELSGSSDNGFLTGCPAAGSIRMTGEDDSEATIYFGDDAPAGYAVQLIGPDGLVEEFETCESFLSSS